MGLFKKVAAAALPFGAGAAALLGKDKLFGKKDTGTADRYINLDPKLRQVVDRSREGQLKGADIYKKKLQDLAVNDTDNLLKLHQTKGKKALIGQAQDAERKAKQLVAQRGLGRSSVGLNAMINAGQESRDKISDLRANAPLMKQKLDQQHMAQVGQATTGLNQILNARGAQRGMIAGRQGTGKRGGGLANLALTVGGGALGAMKGGPQGMSGGMNMGTGLGNVLSGAM